MQNVLLLLAVAVTFAFGWFLMEKLDHFLETNGHMQELQLSSGENTLWLGFCNSTVADGITDVLEQYSKIHLDVSVRIFCGSEEELVEGLSAGKFDVIFLPENAEISAHIHYNSKVISLNYTPVMMKYGGLPIEPIAGGYISQKVLWIGETTYTFAGSFMKCLEDYFAVPTSGK